MNNDSSPPKQKASQPDRRRDSAVQPFKAQLIGVAILFLLAGIGDAYYIHRQNQPVAVVIDGKPIATLGNYQAAKAALSAAQLKQCHGDFPADSFVRLQKVQLTRVPGGTATDDTDTAIAHLAKALKTHVRAYVITVDDKPTIGLPTSEAAGQALIKLKDHFEQMPPNAEVVGDPEFEEHVVVQKMAINPSQTCATADDAVTYFSTPPTIRTYTVRPHETGYSIAHKNHVSFSQFLAANRGSNINSLHPGDTVNLERAQLPITVLVKKQIGVDEKIIANVSEDVAGKRHVTYLATYSNGEETSREATHVATLEMPTLRRR